MRLLILTSRFGSGYGMGYATYKEATALADLGHTITVVYCNPDPDITNYRDKRINFKHLSIKKTPFIGLAMFYFTVRSFFKKCINISDFDAIYIQSLEFGWVNFKKLKIPVFYFVRSTILGPQKVLRSEKTPVSLLGRAVRYLLVFLEKRCLRYSKVIFVKSRIMIDEISRLYRVNQDRVVVINGGIDIKDFSVLPRSAVIDLKNELGISLDSFVVLYAGRIVPQKGLRYLIEASFNLFPKFNFVVVIAGAGLSKSYTTKMKNLVEKSSYQEKFYFLDHIDQLKISSIFNLADCLVTPSLYEPFSMVNLQAAVLGKNIITTDAVGSIYLLADYKNIKIVEAGSLNAIADALQKLMLNTVKLDKASESFDFSCYSWHDVAKQLLKYFSK